jgi:hypothetical protein
MDVLAELAELKAAVKAMRAAQKTYFKARTPEALETSKRWERMVDEMLNPKPKAASLFDAIDALPAEGTGVR